MQAQAQANGLTQEILDEFLNTEDDEANDRLP